MQAAPAPPSVQKQVAGGRRWQQQHQTLIEKLAGRRVVDTGASVSVRE